MHRLAAWSTALALIAMAGIGSASAAERSSTSPPDDAAARALVRAWLVAQNSGQFDAYQKLYAGAFTGVRRSGGRVVKLDRKGWLRDRLRMFEKPMRVAISGLELQATPKGFELELVQRFRSGSYEDQGTKRMALAAERGELRIVREELFDSTVTGSLGAFRPVITTDRGVAVVLQQNPPRVLAVGTITEVPVGGSNVQGYVPVAMDRVSPSIAKQIGATYALFGHGNPICKAARVDGLRIYYRGTTICGDDYHGSHVPSLEGDGQRLLVGDLATEGADCSIASWALPASLPAPTFYPLDKDATVHAAAVAALVHSAVSDRPPLVPDEALPRLSTSGSLCEVSSSTFVGGGSERDESLDLVLDDTTFCGKSSSHVWSLWTRRLGGLELRDAGYIDSRFSGFDEYAWAVDLNGDGRLDLLSSFDYRALISSAAGYTPTELLGSVPVVALDSCDL
jgi:hypothetical protein